MLIDLQAKIAAGDKTPETKQAISHLQIIIEKDKHHQLAITKQSAFIKNKRDNLPAGETLVYMDFSTHLLLPNVNDSNAEQQVWDNIMVEYHRDDAGKIVHHYYDYTCLTPGERKNDAYYVFQCIAHASKRWSESDINIIHIATDCGPKHYRCVYNVRLMAQMVSAWPNPNNGVAFSCSMSWTLIS
jgi:hypothetical protein